MCLSLSCFHCKWELFQLWLYLHCWWKPCFKEHKLLSNNKLTSIFFSGTYFSHNVYLLWKDTVHYHTIEMHVGCRGGGGGGGGKGRKGVGKRGVEDVEAKNWSMCHAWNTFFLFMSKMLHLQSKILFNAKVTVIFFSRGRRLKTLTKFLINLQLKMTLHQEPFQTWSLQAFFSSQLELLKM